MLLLSDAIICDSFAAISWLRKYELTELWRVSSTRESRTGHQAAAHRRNEKRILRLFGSNDVVRAADNKPIVSGILVSSALKKPEFASDTAPGRCLRSKEIAKLTGKYPYVI